MQKHLILSVSLALVAQVVLSGCETRSRGEYAELSNNLTELKIQVESLQKEVEELNASLSTHELMQDQYSSATFDPATNEGFSRLDTSVGSFAVSIQDVTPQADGVKVRLNIGNLTTAVVNGGIFKVGWGSRMPSSKDKDWLLHYKEWLKSVQEKEVSFTDNLQPGTWNSVNITLPGISPHEFGYMKVTMQTNQISLSKHR